MTGASNETIQLSICISYYDALDYLVRCPGSIRDSDWCYRMGDAGWRVVYLPDARVTHLGGKGGTNIRFFRSLYYYHRNPWIISSIAGGSLFRAFLWNGGTMLDLGILVARELSAAGIDDQGRVVGSIRRLTPVQAQPLIDEVNDI